GGVYGKAVHRAASKRSPAHATPRIVTPRRKYKTTALGTRLPLKQTMRGSDVKALQQDLSTLGQTLDVDGEFGPATTQALMAWEASAARPADGVLDADDLAALTGAVATATVASTSTPAPPTAPLAATIGPDGLAVAPAGAPPAVVAFIAAANVIATTPYVYGGGHKSFADTGYDCSGSVSYALHGAGLLDYSLTSGELESYGQPGVGQWITIYANADHTFAVVAGIRFDTSGQAKGGTRWQPLATRSNYTGYVVRHPAGL
ncbi:MAG TPA: peptidoglycan-binding protein, partial [Solirubrobacteraceae bacterium]|nr:peptidoglycan-binding protein [Solirubrobacteraceae bacterium]